MEFKGLKELLKVFDEHGWKGSFSRSNWQIGNGGYDCWFELCYQGMPVAQCIAGELKCISSEISDIEKDTLIKKILGVYEHLKWHNIQQIIVSDIQWDVPGLVDLPKQVTIKINRANDYLLEDVNGEAKNLSDFLSDFYGYCVEGFCVELVEEIPSLDKVISSCEEMSKNSASFVDHRDMNMEER